MTFLRYISPVFCSLAFCAMAEELPLPVAGPMVSGSGEETLRPTMIIKPPVSAPVVTPGVSAEQMAMLEEMERKLVEDHVRGQIAKAHEAGDAAELKQLIVMNGPVDPALGQAAKPPVHAEGQVALIGLEGSAVAKNLEDFFGTPLTPEREKALLETVRQRLLAEGKVKAAMDVRIAGWWPAEGVMAVSVNSRS